jgi:hypothetical protein
MNGATVFVMTMYILRIFAAGIATVFSMSSFKSARDDCAVREPPIAT